MAKTVVRLYKTSYNYIQFTNDRLVELSWEQQSTSDYSKPIYDLYPAYGTLVIKDKGLELYNMALNGEFNDYEYPVKIYVNNALVGNFIVTELPVYSYEDKTLSLVIGDRLSKADNIIYKGYKYPLTPQDLRPIAYDLLKALDNTMTNAELEAVLKNSLVGQGGTTYFDWLQTFQISYPFIESGITLRAAFKQFLTVCQSALVSDVNYKYRFICIDYLSDNYPNAITLASNQITSQFVPTIVLPNKYNICEVASKRVISDFNKNRVIATNEYDKGSSTPYSNNINKNTSKMEMVAATAVEQSCTDVSYSWVSEDLSLYNSTTTWIDLLPVLFNNNLSKIQNFSVEANKNPTYQLTVKKTISWVEGTVQFTKSGNTYRMIANSFAEIEDGESGTTEEYLSIDALTKTETFTYQAKGANNPNVTLSLTTDSEESKYNISSNDEEYRNYIKVFLGRTLNAICAEYNQYLESGTVVGKAELVCAYKYIIKYSFEKLSITYSGDYTEITFKDNTVTQENRASQSIRENKVSIKDGGTLVQYIKTPLIPQTIGNGVLSLFENGLQGGQMEVMGLDYYGFTDAKKNTKMIGYTSTNTSTTVDNKKFFAIGDIVVPCKDRNYTPLMTKIDGNNKTIVHFQVAKNKITYNGGGYKQYLTLRETLTSPIKVLSMPLISLVNSKTIRIEAIDDNTEIIEIYANETKIGEIIKQL